MVSGATNGVTLRGSVWLQTLHAPAFMPSRFTATPHPSPPPPTPTPTGFFHQGIERLPQRPGWAPAPAIPASSARTAVGGPFRFSSSLPFLCLQRFAVAPSPAPPPLPFPLHPAPSSRISLILVKSWGEGVGGGGWGLEVPRPCVWVNGVQLLGTPVCRCPNLHWTASSPPSLPPPPTHTHPPPTTLAILSRACAHVFPGSWTCLGTA